MAAPKRRSPSPARPSTRSQSEAVGADAPSASLGNAPPSPEARPKRTRRPATTAAPAPAPPDVPPALTEPAEPPLPTVAATPVAHHDAPAHLATRPAPAAPTPEAIRHLAYTLWQQRGGRAVDNWLAAERQLTAG